MSRPVSIQDGAVLEAARKVFLRHGYKATTAQVAREAGVSEGSLFKHFRNKPDLFLTAMDVASVHMPWHDRLAEGAGTGDPREMLEFAGRQLLQRLQIIIPRMMMVQSSGLLSPGNCRCFGDVPPPVYHMRVLARYLRAEIRSGRMAMAAPESHAHAFYGALSHYVLCGTLFGYRPSPPAAYVRTVVDALMRSAAPVADRPVRSTAAGMPRRPSRSAKQT